jgi:dephospho-CoA kinase
LLGELGAVVIDADLLARQATDELANEISKHFTIPLNSDGALDRAALAEVVFSDADALRWLESLVHPRVAQLAAQLRAAQSSDALVVYDVALLVEKQMSAQFDKVIVVTAPQDARIERLVGRGLTESDARARIAAQATDAQRAAVADILVDNGADIAALRARAREVYRNLTA